MDNLDLLAHVASFRGMSSPHFLLAALHIDAIEMDPRLEL
jgi:hypothetical protein